MSIKSLEDLSNTSDIQILNWSEVFDNFRNIVNKIETTNLKEQCLRIIDMNDMRFSEKVVPFYRLFIKNYQDSQKEPGPVLDSSIMKIYEFNLIVDRINSHLENIVNLANSAKDNKTLHGRLIQSTINQMLDLTTTTSTLCKRKDDENSIDWILA